MCPIHILYMFTCVFLYIIYLYHTHRWVVWVLVVLASRAHVPPSHAISSYPTTTSRAVRIFKCQLATEFPWNLVMNTTIELTFEVSYHTRTHPPTPTHTPTHNSHAYTTRTPVAHVAACATAATTFDIGRSVVGLSQKVCMRSRNIHVKWHTM